MIITLIYNVSHDSLFVSFHCTIVGSLPDSWSSLINLTHIFLGGNQLTGESINIIVVILTFVDCVAHFISLFMLFSVKRQCQEDFSKVQVCFGLIVDGLCKLNQI